VVYLGAHKAFYVVGSDRVGGMQVPEVVPFASRKDAGLFMEQHGGEVTAINAIPLIQKTPLMRDPWLATIGQLLTCTDDQRSATMPQTRPSRTEEGRVSRA